MPPTPPVPPVPPHASPPPPPPAPGPDPRREPAASSPRAQADERALDRLLAEERFYACPPDLLARIVAEHVTPAWGRARRALAFVASVPLAVGALAIVTGELPGHDLPRLAVDAAAPRPPAPPAFEPGPWAAAGEALRATGAAWIVAAAAVLVLGGVALARRWGVGGTPATPKEVA